MVFVLFDSATEHMRQKTGTFWLVRRCADVYWELRNGQVNEGHRGGIKEWMKRRLSGCRYHGYHGKVYRRTFRSDQSSESRWIPSNFALPALSVALIGGIEGRPKTISIVLLKLTPMSLLSAEFNSCWKKTPCWKFLRELVFNVNRFHAFLSYLLSTTSMLVWLRYDTIRRRKLNVDWKRTVW